MSEQVPAEPLSGSSSSERPLPRPRAVTMFGSFLAAAGLVSEEQVLAWEAEYMEKVEIPLLEPPY